MTARFKVTLTPIEDDDRYRSTLTVEHNGATVLNKCDGGEPEDNSFARDWSWVPGAIRRAYELGFADGQGEQMPSEPKGGGA